jgi:high-affinity Fe2+/Pb2+ permease
MYESIYRRAVFTAATILALTPAQALACPVCALVGSGDNAWAYTAMSVMLILLPLGMIGGAVLWLSRRAALADAELRSPTTDSLPR